MDIRIHGRQRIKMQRLKNPFFISIGPNEAQDLYDELEGVSQEQEVLTELYFQLHGYLKELNQNEMDQKRKSVD